MLVEYIAVCAVDRTDSRAIAKIEGLCALVARRSDIAHHRLGSSGFVAVRQEDGAKVIHRQDEQTAVIGSLFKRADLSSKVDALSEALCADIHTSAGCLLIESYWGSYVALQVSPGPLGVHVMRDPSGCLSAYYYQKDGLLYLFSRLGFLVELLNEGPPAKVNWEFVQHYLAFSKLIKEDTGLLGVHSLRPGTSYLFDRAGVECRQHWSPGTYAKRGPLPVCGSYDAALRRCVEDSVNAHSLMQNSLSVRLSGGLDSSIVAGCLSSAMSPQSVLSVNLFDRSMESDERFYARAVCTKHGYRLATQEVDGYEMAVEDAAAASLHVSPTAHIFGQHLCTVLARHAKEFGAQRMLTGFGGDAVFFSDSTHLVAADILRDLPADSLSLLRLKATTTRTPLPKVLVDALKHGLLRVPEVSLLGRHLNTTLMSESARQALRADYLMHAWVQEVENTLGPAKKRQIVAITACLQYYDAPWKWDGITEGHPLVAQPVVEHCLATPSYRLFPGPSDRTLARSAFRSVLPGEGYARRSKGGVTTYISDFVNKNRRAMCEVLRHGRLQREGLLDTRTVESVLAGARPVEGSNIQSVLSALSVELWLSAIHDLGTQRSNNLSCSDGCCR